jgi:hypothetical protein
MADASGKLASWQRGWGLFNAHKEGAAGDRVWSVEDCSRRVDVEVVIVKVFVVQVVWDKVAGGIIGTLLAAAGLGAVVLTVSLLSKHPLGACWARC